MSFDWSTGELATGLACYRSSEFFETHEHWESAWNRLEGLEKLFLQGLIQVTVAMHHYQRGNFAGALSLLRRALEKFAQVPGDFGGIDVEVLSIDVRAWLSSLENGHSIPPLPPRIRPLHG